MKLILDAKTPNVIESCYLRTTRSNIFLLKDPVGCGSETVCLDIFILVLIANSVVYPDDNNDVLDVILLLASPPLASRRDSAVSPHHCLILLTFSSFPVTAVQHVAGSHSPAFCWMLLPFFTFVSSEYVTEGFVRLENHRDTCI